MTTTIDTTADRALKAKHRAMWALGDYPAVATEVDPASSARSWSRPRGRRRATGCSTWPPGTGNAAIPAALAGAEVVASDLTPELFDGRAGSRRPARRRARRGRRPTPRRCRSPTAASTSCCPASA